MIKLNESDLKNICKHVLKDYVNKDMVYLKDYFNQSDDSKKEFLAFEYHYFFDDFLEETGYEFNFPKDEQYEDNYGETIEGDEIYGMDLIEWLSRNDKVTFNEFSEYLFNKIKDDTLPIDPSEYPAWAYFDDKPELIKNQWLIHFTKDANAIAKEGFTYGVDEINKLGLTTHLSEFEKYGGYNFSYLLKDFPRYSRSSYSFGSGYKYGKEAVIFKASGFRLYHYGDEEPQTIFYGNTATNIIPITKGEELEWGIYNFKNGRLIFENNDLEKIVEWLTNNYIQYKNILHK